MSLNASSSRVGQHVSQLVFEGMRYKEILNGQLLDLPQRTGLMLIIDEATNSRVDIVKIYDVPHDPTLEADVQDVFFKVFELACGRREIQITNERDVRFIFAIDSRSVSRLP